MERTELDFWSSREVARLLALVENERVFFQEILAALPVPIAVVTPELAIRSINRAFRKAIGQLQSLVHSGIAEHVTEALTQEQPRGPIPVTLADPAGASCQWTASIVPLLDLSDQTRQNALLVLQPAPPREEPKLPAVPCAVWSLDSSGAITFRNQHSAAIIGNESLEAWAQRAVPEDEPRLETLYRQAAETGTPATICYRATHADGHELWLADYVSPSANGLDIVTADDTARANYFSARHQTRKLEALSRISGRLAHDINNILTVIVGNAELLHQTTAVNHPEWEATRQILEGAERIAAISAELRNLGRPAFGKPSVFDLNEFLRRTTVGAKLDLSTEPEPVSADQGILGQALRDLSIWAADRLPDGAVLELKTSRRRQISDFGPPGPGVYVDLRIGPLGGLSDDYVERWPEPFPNGGREASPGLMPGYQSLAMLGVSITIEKSREQTAFVLSFPVSSAEIPVVAAPAGPLVLVADDEENVRTLVSRILVQAGYRTLEAKSGEDALQLASGHEGGIDLVISDVMLSPRGPEVVRRIREKHPGLKAIYISGYSDDPQMAQEHLLPGERFLAKPFRGGVLIDLVRSLT